MDDSSRKTSSKARRGRATEASDERIRERATRTILRAAAELFAEKGYDGVSMLQIAKASGLPRANVYYYFDAKEDIYRALISELIHGWELALRHFSPESDPKEAFSAYIRAKLDYGRHHPIQSRLFATEIMGGAKFLTRRDRDYMHALTKERILVLEQWMDEGRIRRVDARHLLMLLWGATQFLTLSEPVACDTLETGTLKPADFDAAAEAISAIVLGGVLPNSN
ncbi:transcriptional regulator, TetR family [Pseudooceanicola antarcticus]|uniref:Transcriptional regulator, TetR family n=1 Tax=Pseudooceanicola antarcticus TaxID=1247613 RepID=A0A285JDZ6_9RHOB|nr:TetR/AcrR family transcriptional regulator [Pseudooceanicola antarcticus]SNY58499.1 transcriptional regulator, TetR family [Pseudooceanicola antarcticus]